MLLVRGPSIFNGYLNYDGPDPFIEVDGKRWYVTGDLVRLDEDGYIYFRGRLKRFLKIGGEMVSLPALEEPFSEPYPPTENGPQVAVEGVDAPGRWIVLFTTLDISLRQANALLAEAGFRGVMRLDAVQRMEAIPVLGTGKTDYKVLRKAGGGNRQCVMGEGTRLLPAPVKALNVLEVPYVFRVTTARAGGPARNCGYAAAVHATRLPLLTAKLLVDACRRVGKC